MSLCWLGGFLSLCTTINTSCLLLEDSGYNSIEREYLGKYSDSFPGTLAPSAHPPYGLESANFPQETRNIHREA